LTALKRKKLIESQLEKVSASKLTLEQQRMALEQINISKITFDAIDGGKRELERLNKEMGVDRVEETMDDLKEQLGLTEEAADALARPLNAGDDDVRARSLGPSFLCSEVAQGAGRGRLLTSTLGTPASLSAWSVLTRAGRARARARRTRAGHARRAHPQNRRRGPAAGRIRHARRTRLASIARDAVRAKDKSARDYRGSRAGSSDSRVPC
jgi:hypothetical protein